MFSSQREKIFMMMKSYGSGNSHDDPVNLLWLVGFGTLLLSWQRCYCYCYCYCYYCDRVDVFGIGDHNNDPVSFYRWWEGLDCYCPGHQSSLVWSILTISFWKLTRSFRGRWFAQTISPTVLAETFWTIDFDTVQLVLKYFLYWWCSDLLWCMIIPLVL